MMTSQTAVAGFVAVLLTACGSDSSSSGDADSEPPAPMTSIAFCSEPAIDLIGGAGFDDDALAAQDAARELRTEVEARFGERDGWAGTIYDRAEDRVLVRLADDPQLVADVEREFGSRVVILDVEYSVEEQEAARDRLIERVDGHPDSPVTGISVESIYPQVAISLENLDAAATFVEDWDIPPPYEIYCFYPTPDPQ